MVVSKFSSHIRTKQVLSVGLAIVALYVILSQLHVFRDSLKQLDTIDYAQLVLAFGAIALTFVLGALVYKTLAFKKLSYGRTLIAQIAANFINRLLPAGIGGIGINYRYLRNQNHSPAQAASVVTANNSLGLIGHGLLLLTLTTLFHGHVVPVHVSHKVTAVVLGVAMALVLVLLALPKIRRRISRSVQAFGKQISRYQTRPAAVGTALLLQICLTLANITAFWLCVLAVHASLTFVAALLVFSFGFGVGGAAPTPGGLGGVEAGLAAGLIAYHLASPTALAAVIMYRLVSYWLPLALSGLFFWYASRRQYFH